MNIEDLKGIGNKTLKSLNKLGIKTIEDLITYYPYNYNVLKRSNIDVLDDGDKIVIDGIIETIPNVFYYGYHKDRMTFKLNTGNYLLDVCIFNRSFLKSKLTVGTSITVIGTFEKKYSKITVSDIRFTKLSNIPVIEPVYHINSSITNKELRKYIAESLKYLNKISIIVPKYLQDKYHLLDKYSSIKEIHNPHSETLLKKAINYLKYEELFIFVLKMTSLKMLQTKECGLNRKIEWNDVENIISMIPFELTSDQLKAIKEIYDDLNSEKRMTRLLQGDVGSGKTIVAFIALYMNYLSGYQGALMAPTEVLATQHYNNIKKLFPKLKVGLLTGSLKTKEKKELYNQIADGAVSIIIGTHALITDKVIYKNLGLVITDEQHRFGVNQRSTLKNKGITPDILYLSATPIPRTYALTIYGDMDISSIKTKPNGRKEVITYLRKSSDLKEILELMLTQIKHHHQIYVIAPLIENAMGESNLDSVIELKEKMEKAFSKICKVGIMHGKLSNEEKDKVMLEFKENKISILVSTTVIEVGVDVSNATMIVVFDSYRFGLSQLHQLRGRVGRNDLDSYCILISDKFAERLNILTTTNDGFKISEEDFKLRGSGDLFGVKQSGDMVFKLANIKNDFNILLAAKKDAEEIITCKELISDEIAQIIHNSINLE